jgi:hypothetical protein
LLLLLLWWWLLRVTVTVPMDQPSSCWPYWECQRERERPEWTERPVWRETGRGWFLQTKCHQRRVLERPWQVGVWNFQTQNHLLPVLLPRCQRVLEWLHQN